MMYHLVHIFPRARRVKKPGSRWKLIPQPMWMRRVAIGDVLEIGTGRVQRVVRAVTFYSCGALHSVTFTIKHCSWTHRCDTVVDVSRLLTEGWHPAGVRMELNTRLDQAIAREIMSKRMRARDRRRHQRRLDCCDVKGIP